jgi:hypothetical protein
MSSLDRKQKLTGSMAPKSQSWKKLSDAVATPFSSQTHETHPAATQGAVMREPLQVVFDVVNGEFSYRHAWRESPDTKLLLPPTLTEIPASVLCSREVSRHDVDQNNANTAQPSCSPSIVIYLSQHPEVSGV